MDPGPTVQVQQLSFEVAGRRILHAIDALFPGGQLTAILGPSGSGKSTLLKCVAAVHTPTEGRVLCDGADVRSGLKLFRSELGYVPQDDVIHRRLRTESALRYAVRLRLPELDGDRAERRVESVCRSLGLSDQRRQRIHRLSGGQRKRVNIGVELLADPRLLVLDEPASGLDPATEEDLLEILTRRTEAGTVIFTTHSMEFLHRVSRVVFLMEGHLIFEGSLAELCGHFDIQHAADVYRRIREDSVSHWVDRRRRRQTAVTP